MYGFLCKILFIIVFCFVLLDATHSNIDTLLGELDTSYVALYDVVHGLKVDTVVVFS